MGKEIKNGSSSATVLLLRWKDGDPKAMEELLPLVYDELRRLAQSYLRREREAVKETIAYYDERAPFKKGDDTSLSVKRVDRCREDDA